MCQLGERLPPDVIEIIGSNVPLKVAARAMNLSESTLRGWCQTMLLDEQLAGLFSKVQGNVFFDLKGYAEMIKEDQDRNRRRARKFRRGMIPVALAGILALGFLLAFAFFKWLHA